MNSQIAMNSKNATCPCCGYKNALSTARRDSKDLYFCHAGCSQADLLAAIRGEALPYTISHQRTNHGDVRKYAEALWKESLPGTDTPVAEYFKQRGLGEKIPDSIRFLRAVRHKPSGIVGPVMLAAIMDITGRLQGVHRTWLTPDGRGKAPIDPPKMTLGKMRGFACHLAPPAERMAVGEGLENSLTILHVMNIPTWSGISAGGVRNLVLPPLPQAQEVIICADHDENGCGQTAAKDAACRWHAEGRRIRIVYPPSLGQDFNDLLLEAAQ